MDHREIDFLRYWLNEVPEYADRVRTDPPRALHAGRWRPIVAVRTVSNAIRLSFPDGSLMRLPIAAGRRGALRPEGFWETVLRRNFPRARVTRVLHDTDRMRHQSGAFVRVLVHEGSSEKALIWATPNESEAVRERLLSALLLWWHDLQSSHRPERAVCFVPGSWSRRIVSGLRQLRFPVRCYRYRLEPDAQPGRLERIYPAPPFETSVNSPYVVFPQCRSAPSAISRLAGEFPALRLSRRPTAWELDFKGLPVAWSRDRGRLMFNLTAPQPLVGLAPFRRHLERVKRIRTFPSPCRDHPFFTWKPERWLEHETLRDHRKIDPAFGREIHVQVPTCIDGERKVLDLLTCTREGRLAVVELKVCQDLNLIFQALEYWSRVRVHLKRGDFQHLGYFPNRRLQTRRPLLYLVCPLFEYHRVLPIFRRHLDARVKFHCIGINSDWRKGLRVIRRFEF